MGVLFPCSGISQKGNLILKIFLLEAALVLYGCLTVSNKSSFYILSFTAEFSYQL